MSIRVSVHDWRAWVKDWMFIASGAPADRRTRIAIVLADRRRDHFSEEQVADYVAGRRKLAFLMNVDKMDDAWLWAEHMKWAYFGKYDDWARAHLEAYIAMQKNRAEAQALMR